MKADVKATEKYYEQIDDTQLCDCTDCQNYRARLTTSHPDTAIEKEHFVLEIYPIKLVRE